MPTSHWQQLNEIVGVMMAIRPKSLLDIGAGFGKYGMLAREYLELWDGREKYADWQCRIDGIEAHGMYSNTIHMWAYDEMHYGNALDLLPGLNLARTYDLVLLIDVLEHFTRSDGAHLLDLCTQHRNVLIATPHNPSDQGAAFQNEYETHRSKWAPGDIPSNSTRVSIPNLRSVIVCVGEDAGAVAASFPNAILC